MRARGPCAMPGVALLIAGCLLAVGRLPAQSLAPAAPSTPEENVPGAAAGAPISGSIPVTLSTEAGRALASNPAMTQAVNKLRSSEARLSEELALRFPQYGLTLSEMETKASGYTLFNTLNAVLSVPLDTAGKNGQLIRQARADLDAARWQFRRSASDMTYQVAAAYFGVLRAEQDAAIAADTYQQSQQQTQAAQKRVDAGDAPQTDLLKSQVQEVQSQADLMLARSASDQARASLNSLVGRRLLIPVLLAPAGDLVGALPSQDQADSRLSLESPEIRASEAAVTSADVGVELARSEGRPSVSVQGVYTRTGDPTTYPDALGAGLSVNVPLPDGGGRRSRVEEASAALLIARAARDQARQQAQLDLANAYLALDDARQRAQITSQGVRLATESLRTANLGYTNGVSTARDVIDAQVALRQARTQDVEAGFALELAGARIQNVLGGAPPGITLPEPGAAAITVPAVAPAGTQMSRKIQ